MKQCLFVISMLQHVHDILPRYAMVYLLALTKELLLAHISHDS